ncbi:MAG: hypothetical protein QXN37_03080 [Candidatus Anstonellaceae archaeon]
MMIAKKVAQSGVHDNVPPKVKTLGPLQRALLEEELAGQTSTAKKQEDEKNNTKSKKPE